jgi:hypothetical protein
MRDKAADDRFAAGTRSHQVIQSFAGQMLQNFVDHAVAQHADIVGLDLDDIAGL